MADKFKLSRKVKKIILGACIGGVVVLTAGLFTYIHIADTNTLGRKISIYGMDVSTLTADKAEQKLLDAFRSRKVQFKEGGSDVYQTTVSELGYDLDESVERAKKYISGALAAMLDLGKGSGPMNHGFAIKNEYTESKVEE